MLLGDNVKIYKDVIVKKNKVKKKFIGNSVMVL
jgi:hypothetical protein